VVDVEFLYNKYGPMVFRRCRNILKDEERALDAMQDVFVKVLEKEKKLNQTAPSSLLYTIATNHCLNILRGQKDMSGAEVLEEITASGENMENRITQKMMLEEIFSQEKSSTRLIAYLHYVDRLTLEETAQFVGLSVSGVRKRLRKLRETGLKLKGECA
jgi:RNA polymerase sigma-70 factor (ECF subfamily)